MNLSTVNRSELLYKYFTKQPLKKTNSCSTQLSIMCITFLLLFTALQYRRTGTECILLETKFHFKICTKHKTDICVNFLQLWLTVISQKGMVCATCSRGGGSCLASADLRKGTERVEQVDIGGPEMEL